VTWIIYGNSGEGSLVWSKLIALNVLSIDKSGFRGVTAEFQETRSEGASANNVKHIGCSEENLKIGYTRGSHFPLHAFLFTRLLSCLSSPAFLAISSPPPRYATSLSLDYRRSRFFQLGSPGNAVSTPCRSGTEPQLKYILAHISFKIRILVASISIIFLTINCPNFVNRFF